MDISEMSGMIPVTALYVGLHALLAVVLANLKLLYEKLGKHEASAKCDERKTPWRKSGCGVSSSVDSLGR